MLSTGPRSKPVRHTETIRVAAGVPLRRYVPTNVNGYLLPWRSPMGFPSSRYLTALQFSAHRRPPTIMGDGFHCNLAPTPGSVCRGREDMTHPYELHPQTTISSEYAIPPREHITHNTGCLCKPLTHCL